MKGGSGAPGGEEGEVTMLLLQWSQVCWYCSRQLIMHALITTKALKAHDVNLLQVLCNILDMLQ